MSLLHGCCCVVGGGERAEEGAVLVEFAVVGLDGWWRGGRGLMGLKGAVMVVGLVWVVVVGVLGGGDTLRGQNSAEIAAMDTTAGSGIRLVVLTAC